MSGKLSEKEMLQKLGVPGFEYVGKAELLPFAKNMSKMDPNAAKKATERIPLFIPNVTAVLEDYRGIFEKAMEENRESAGECYKMYNRLMDTLEQMMAREDLTFEERKYILEQMKLLTDKVSRKDSENKKFWKDVLKIAGFFCLGALALGGGAAAVKYMQKSSRDDSQDLLGFAPDFGLDALDIPDPMDGDMPDLMDGDIPNVEL